MTNMSSTGRISGRMLQVNGKFLGRAGATALREWIENEIKKNIMMNLLIRCLLLPVPIKKIPLHLIIKS